MRNRYRRGRKWEYEAVKELREMGYQAQRTAGSHSPFDVIAWRNDEMKLIQVKRLNHSSLMARTVQEAKVAWEDRDMPLMRGVHVELWVRQNGKWHVFRLD